MTRGGERAGGLHAGGPAAHDRDTSERPRGASQGAELELIAGARVDHARHAAIEDRAVDARLVARDAHVDRTTAGRIPRLVHDLRIRQERPGERHEIGVAGCEHLLGESDRVDPVGRDHGHIDRVRHSPRPRPPRAMGHERLDGRGSRLVPAHADVQSIHCAAGGQPSGKFEHLVQRRATLDERSPRHPEHDRLLGAAGRPHRRRHRQREPHPPLGVPAPLVVAQVGRRREELVDQVALRAHDLDAVEAELAGPSGPAREVVDRHEHLLAGQRPRLAAAVARVHGRGRHRRQPERRLVRVPAGMEELEQHEAPDAVDRVRHPRKLRSVRVLVDEAVVAPAGADAADRRPAGHDQPRSAQDPLAVERSQSSPAVVETLEPEVHRAHHDPVGQRQRADRARPPHVLEHARC